MAKLIQGSTVGTVWLEAVEHLLDAPRNSNFNLILEISQPNVFGQVDAELMGLVDDLVIGGGHDPMNTVAGTLFPVGLYRRHGLEKMCDVYRDTIYPKIRKSNRWGTYFGRATMRIGKDGQAINPLRDLVEKLSTQSKSASPAKSHYEMGVIDAIDVPIFDPSQDRKLKISGPCLSHLSFKLVDTKEVRLTGIYRSHYYIQRAFGNLLALAQLQACVAKEAKLCTGPLTCISTYAKVDVGDGWSLGAVRDVVKRGRELLSQVAA
jgi:hypothetical protein